MARGIAMAGKYKSLYIVTLRVHLFPGAKLGTGTHELTQQPRLYNWPLGQLRSQMRIHNLLLID
jgi:hypothetical protein